MKRYLLLWGLLAVVAWGVAHPARPEARQEPASILIDGGLLIDGTGAKRRAADVRVMGDKIREVGALSPREGERVIDARGRVVAPGFIDTHSHADGGIFESPEAESQIRQGITTAIVGQDGGSRLPLAGFFEQLTAKPAALNFASFVGHGTVRRQVMGADYKRAITADELAKMRALIEQEMQAGGLGLSTGLEYDPGFYSTTEELIACAKAAAQHEGRYISHVRDEQNGALQSFRELIRIAEEARLPAQISHIKLGSQRVWGRAAEAVRLMEGARRRGVEVTADIYPYLYWSSTITAIVPSRDWENRAIWEKGLADIGGPDRILLAGYSPEPSWAGKTLAALAKETGKDPVSLIQEIVRKTRGEGARGSERVVVTAMDEADLRRFMRAPHVMFCSDGGLRSSHPRGAGTYPRILGRYVRQWRVLSLEAAVRKMTRLPAQTMGFRDRGTVRPGMRADLVVFNPHTIMDTATPERPASRPVGVTHVMVNGSLVLDGGRVTGERPGRGLRHRSSATRSSRFGLFPTP